MWTRSARQRGGALLAVLWLSAALSAIAFTVASTVRGETERTATAADALRGYYLAAGALDRAILHMQWGPLFRNPDGSARYYQAGQPRMRFDFPSGVAEVEVIPEAAKLNLNSAPAGELLRLLGFLGADPDRARLVTQAILDWRSPGQGISEFDQHYLSLAPSFRSRHASFEETEELLVIRGMTPDLYYGGYERDPEGRLVPRAGLRDCVSVFGSGTVEVNTAEPAVLAAVGMPPETIGTLVELRRRAPLLRTLEPLAGLVPANVMGRLRVGGGTLFTLRSTATLRLPDNSLSDVRRSVSALVKFMPPEFGGGIHVLRWYDSVWSGGAATL